jgi:hypothetical protein
MRDLQLLQTQVNNWGVNRRFFQKSFDPGAYFEIPGAQGVHTFLITKAQNIMKTSMNDGPILLSGQNEQVGKMLGVILKRKLRTAALAFCFWASLIVWALLD